MNKDVVKSHLEIISLVVSDCYKTKHELRDSDYDIIMAALKTINNEINIENLNDHNCFEYLVKRGDVYVCKQCGREFYD